MERCKIFLHPCEFPTFESSLNTLGDIYDTDEILVSITTMTALLALHIESALDPTQTDLVHSMNRISISQTMLLLGHGKDIPVLKRALPVFEEWSAAVAGQGTLFQA